MRRDSERRKELQESRVRRTGKEDMSNQVGKNGESQGSESGRGRTEEATVRQRREERGKEETESQVVRTGTEVDERKWKEREKPEGDSRREAPVEQLWERNREG